ncbi:MAG: hypothetical protein V4498_06685 [candidate division FCPU426 bacterium]
MTLQFRFQLDEAATQSGVSPDLILHFISLTWIKPLEGKIPLFDEEDIARIQLIGDLQDRMGVNDESVPVIMHLIDQLNRMHLELNKKGEP